MGARDYVSGIEYQNGGIEAIHTEEGVARSNSGPTIMSIT